MKRLSNLLAALVFASLVIFMSCGGGGSDPAPDPLIAVAANLTGTAYAEPTTVQTDGGEADGNWDNFTISFEGNESGGTYDVNGVPDGFEDVWADGSWTFGNASGSVITKVQGGVTTDMTATIAAGSLTLTFEVADPSGRTSGIAGNWTFVFN